MHAGRKNPGGGHFHHLQPGAKSIACGYYGTERFSVKRLIKKLSQ
jgi:hypothetical protein